MFLPDGDLFTDGQGRTRHFRWKGIDENSQLSLFGSKEMWGNEDEINTELISEEEIQRRKERYERETFIREEMVCNGTMNVVSLETVPDMYKHMKLCAVFWLRTAWNLSSIESVWKSLQFFPYLLPFKILLTFSILDISGQHCQMMVDLHWSLCKEFHRWPSKAGNSHKPAMNFQFCLKGN